MQREDRAECDINRCRVACLILLISSTVCRSPVFAHQPRIVAPGVARVAVEQPEVSKAYYGILDGQPQLFTVRSDKGFVLYANILVPKVPGIEKDVSAEIRDGKGKLIGLLQAAHSRWTVFHEPFAGDDYYKGPEFKRRVPAAVYTITVSRPGNRGRYVLAIGEKEEFPLREVARALVVLPSLKADFFGKSRLSVLWSYTGAFLAFAALAMVGVVYLLVKLFRWRGRVARRLG